MLSPRCDLPWTPGYGHDVRTVFRTVPLHVNTHGTMGELVPRGELLAAPQLCFRQALPSWLPSHEIRKGRPATHGNKVGGMC